MRGEGNHKGRNDAGDGHDAHGSELQEAGAGADHEASGGEDIRQPARGPQGKLPKDVDTGIPDSKDARTCTIPVHSTGGAARIACTEENVWEKPTAEDGGLLPDCPNASKSASTQNGFCRLQRIMTAVAGDSSVVSDDSRVFRAETAAGNDGRLRAAGINKHS